MPLSRRADIISGMTTKNLTGIPAIPFQLSDSLGRLYSLADFSGHWLLLVFHRHLG